MVVQSPLWCHRNTINAVKTILKSPRTPKILAPPQEPCSFCSCFCCNVWQPPSASTPASAPARRRLGNSEQPVTWCAGVMVSILQHHATYIYIYIYIYIVDTTVEVNHILVVVICSKQQMLKGLLSFASENRTPNYIMMVVLLMAVRHLNYDNMWFNAYTLRVTNSGFFSRNDEIPKTAGVGSCHPLFSHVH